MNIINFVKDDMEIRVIEKDGCVEFLLSDIGRSLGFVNERDNMLRYDRIKRNTLDSYKKCSEITPPNWVDLEPNIFVMNRYVSESVLYMLMMSTKNDRATIFQVWLATEVLPSIRKNGFYLGESFDKDELEKQLREKDVIIDNFSNVLKFNKKRTQLLKTFITDMFPSNKDAYGQFVQSMIKAKMLTEDLQPTEVFDIQNKRKNMFVHNTRVGLNGTNIELQLTNIGMEELAKRLYLEDGELKIKKVELGVVNKTNLTLF
ncbi:MAG: BRO-N domain-containing protein [Cetobacterium sp.]